MKDLDAPDSGGHPPTLKILVADDSRLNRRLATLLLSVLGQECDTVTGGIDAVERAITAPYDLILMDVQMSDLDGIDATIRIREALSSDTQPMIVAMTPTSPELLRERCIRAGMDDYIAKPLTREALEAVMTMATIRRDARNDIRSGIDPAAFDLFRRGFDEAGEIEMKDVVERFLLLLDEKREAMNAALMNRDTEGLQRLAHSLKSSSRWIGARRLAGLCSRLEMMARSGYYSDVESILESIETESTLIRSDLDRQLAR